MVRRIAVMIGSLLVSVLLLGVGDSEVAGGELGGGGSLTSSVVVAQRRALLLAMTR